MKATTIALKRADGNELITIDEACRELSMSYGDLSVVEAITRAFIAERSHSREMALFWVDVYKILTRKEVGNLTIFEKISASG